MLRQAREEAELQGIDLAVYVAAGAYEFMRLDQRTYIWVPMQGDALYVPRELPEGLRFRMWLESREIVLKPRLPQRVCLRRDSSSERRTLLDDFRRSGGGCLPIAAAKTDIFNAKTGRLVPPRPCHSFVGRRRAAPIWQQQAVSTLRPS